MFRLQLLVIASLLGVAGSATAQAEQPREGLRELAAQLGDRVKKAIGDRPIRVGYFTPTGIDHSNSGGALAESLLFVLGQSVNTEAKLELKGEYSFVSDEKNPAVKVIRIEASIKDLDRGGNYREFLPYEGVIRHNADIARLVGAHLTSKPDEAYNGDPYTGRNKEIQKSIPPGPGKPPELPGKTDGKTFVVCGKYDIEILAGKEPEGEFKPLRVELADAQYPGLPVVELDSATYYRVRVVNRDAVEIAVFLHLDGIDQFTFSENKKPDGRPQFQSWIVQPAKEVTIKGWHRNVDPGEVFGFLTTQAGKGAASKFPTLSVGKTGTICVGIAYTKPEGTRGPGLETTTGVPIAVKQAAVKRAVGDPHEIVTIRYSR